MTKMTASAFAADSRAGAGGLRFVLATIGTRGDLNPLLAIAEELARRRHTVTFAVPRRHRVSAESRGFRSFPLGPDADDPRDLQPAEPADVKRRSAQSLRGVLFPGVAESYRDLLAATEDADLLAGHYILLPLPMAAERRGIPWVPFYFAPGTLNSMHDPPLIPMLPQLHRAQRSSHHIARALNGVFKRAIDAWYKPYHELRAQEGFAPERHNYILDGVHSPYLDLGLFSEAIGARQPDWAATTVASGFPFIEESFSEAHAELQAFLENGPAPIVATLGSAKLAGVRHFFETSLEAAQRLGKRIVLLTGALRENAPEHANDGSVFIAGYAPYAPVFRHACAVVHSGAVGALAEALRAGKPMLVVPASAADQPDNAFRAARLGVGLTLPMRKYTPARAASALRVLLTHPSYAERAVAIGAQIRSEDGAARAADLLEQTARAHAKRAAATAGAGA